MLRCTSLSGPLKDMQLIKDMKQLQEDMMQLMGLSQEDRQHAVARGHLFDVVVGFSGFSELLIWFLCVGRRVGMETMGRRSLLSNRRISRVRVLSSYSTLSIVMLPIIWVGTFVTFTYGMINLTDDYSF